MLQRTPTLVGSKVRCHECGDDFDRVGYHWNNGSCDHPDLRRSTVDVVTGLLLGDGTLRTQSTHPFVQAYSTNVELLTWIDNRLGWVSTGVSLYRSDDDDNHSDVYEVSTRALPDFDVLDSDKLSTSVELSPTVATVWYACRGALHWDPRYPSARPYATIGTSAIDSAGELVDWFDSSGCPVVPDRDGNSLRFDVESTRPFVEWLDDPPAGVEHKFETTDFSAYRFLQP